MRLHSFEIWRTIPVFWLFLICSISCPGNSSVHAKQDSAKAKSSATASKHDDFDTLVRPFIGTWCMRCHRGKDAEGGLDLLRFKSQEDINADLETWKAIVEAVDSEFMPPAEEEQPPTRWAQWLKDWYFKTTESVNQSSRVPPMRRLNRVEYENTVSDLLRIDSELFGNASQVLMSDEYFDAASKQMPRYVMAISYFSYRQKRPPLMKGLPEVPSDPPVEHGYSNNHVALSFSPLQAERYFELANAIVNSKVFPRVSDLWDAMFVPPNDATIEKQKLVARDRLRTFLIRAFRRDVTKLEVDRYADLFNKHFAEASDYTQAMKTSVTAILSSPSFLFRQDFSAGSFSDQEVDPLAMASRLSYFLWASMPDDQLFQAAREGRLNTRSGLVREVRRMMNDKKIKSLATDFGMQWLKVASVSSSQPDEDLFPEFYKSDHIDPSVSMMVEQLLYFETIMIEDRSIMEFIDSDWGYLNGNLMSWYQLNPNAILGYTPKESTFEDFFRVKLSNKRKGGVITAGATLISTSATTRTSPVYRGAWVLEVIFNRPPQPPPANVPALEKTDGHAEKPLNVVERLELHRRDANCAVCHDRIDPMGYALEGFDAVGRLRSLYSNKTEINTKGMIFDKEFDGAASFKAIILDNEREFIQGFTEHMSKYALGRGLELEDKKEIEGIVDDVIASGKKFSAVVEGIVTSNLFRLPARLATKTEHLQTSDRPESPKAHSSAK